MIESEIPKLLNRISAAAASDSSARRRELEVVHVTSSSWQNLAVEEKRLICPAPSSATRCATKQSRAHYYRSQSLGRPGDASPPYPPPAPRRMPHASGRLLPSRPHWRGLPPQPSARPREWP